MIAAFQTEFAFTLPYGYVDERGNLHREGIMRRATTMDEIAPLRDPRVRANDAYLSVVLLSRVITRLGSLPAVGCDIVERLFATDFIYLQQLYMRMNENAHDLVETQCPTCATRFMLDLTQSNGNDEQFE
jgi:hypothetical protein